MKELIDRVRRRASALWHPRGRVASVRHTAGRVASALLPGTLAASLTLVVALWSSLEWPDALRAWTYAPVLVLYVVASMALIGWRPAGVGTATLAFAAGVINGIWDGLAVGTLAASAALVVVIVRMARTLWFHGDGFRP